MNPTHLITGVTGQDGILLARLLLQRGFRVLGTSRDAAAGRASPNLAGVTVIEHDILDGEGFRRIITEHRPAAVHNLAAITSVADSWEEPERTDAVNHRAVEAMLAILRALGEASPSFVQASSAEIFGPTRIARAAESTPLDPVSPYAEAKAAAHLAVQAARDAGMRTTNLILFGHTSALQTDRFVLPLVAQQAAEVKLGRRDRIELRDPDVHRDWCSAHDVASAFAAAADGPAGDYVIASGELHGLQTIGSWALQAVGAPTRPIVRGDGAARRPRDFDGVTGDTSRARASLGWTPARPLRTEIEHMARVSLARLRSGDGTTTRLE